MKLDFVKLNGLGNDFVFIEDLSTELELSADQVRGICDRHFGIGADGVILVRPSCRKECRAYMHYINSDGTLAQMCGNGVRCFAKYLVDRGYVDAKDGELVADTLAGPKRISFVCNEDGKLIEASVDMGSPELDPDLIPVKAELNSESSDSVSYSKAAIASKWGELDFVFVSMGNPHAVTFVKDWNALPDELFESGKGHSIYSFKIDEIGRYYESNGIFPERCNIEFAEVDGDMINMRVFERGCGETFACGTGACATSVAATLEGLSGRQNRINLKGGPLFIDWQDSGHVVMTGQAQESFTGELEIQ